MNRPRDAVLMAAASERLQTKRYRPRLSQYAPKPRKPKLTNLGRTY